MRSRRAVGCLPAVLIYQLFSLPFTPLPRKGRPTGVLRRSYATVTQEGQELEELLRNTSRISERQFFDSYQAVLAKGRDGPVPGLRKWLRDLDLEDHAHQAMMWADEMGACDLDEVLENLEEFSHRLGLEEPPGPRFRAAAEATKEVTVTPRPMNGSEREELLHFWSMNWRALSAFEGFDQRFERLQDESWTSPVGDGMAEMPLTEELRKRRQGDLQYLRVIRQEAERNLPQLPSLDGQKTWTFCGGSEAWLSVAQDTAAPKALAPLPRPWRRSMERAVLGELPRGKRFLQTYVALERFHPDDLRGEFPIDAVNRSKQLCLDVAKELHGAGGLPDWNRTIEDAPVPLGITRESLENKTEVVRQLRRYYELMDNTRIGQADKYFGHVLFGLLLSRLWMRFDLLRSSNLLTLDDVASQRALLEQRLQQDDERLEERLFEAYATRSLEGQGAEPWLHLAPATLSALRRHTEAVFGRGLREEIFVPLSRAAREGASRGLLAAGPGLCCEVLTEAAQKGQLRMLSLSDGSKERLMWHGLVFGSLLGQHELPDPKKLAKTGPPVAVGNISSFFGPKKGTEAKQAASPKAASPSPVSKKASPEAPKLGGNPPAGSPSVVPGPEQTTTPTKVEVKAPVRTPEKPSPVGRRGPATPMSTGKFHGFQGVKPSSWQQYNGLYKLRLKQLGGAAREEASQRWSSVPKSSFLTDLTGFMSYGHRDVVVVGVLFKELKGRPNVIEEYKGSKALLNQWKEETSCIYTEKDTLWLEDAVMRIELEAPKETVARLATGLVVALHGTPTQAGTFTLKDFCFPRMPLPAPLDVKASKEGPFLALMSGLGFGEEAGPSVAASRAKAFEFLKAHSVQQLVICGGLLPEGRDQIKAALRELNLELPKLCETICVQVMPGAGEPSNASLPQLRFHQSLFQFSSENFNTVGNPCGFKLGAMDILGHSGQPIKDLLRCAQLDPLEALEMCLKARHLAPTAPDTLPTQPFEDRDPFVMDAVPHLLFSGGHQRAEKKWCDVGERGTQCICVPSFAKQPAVVLVNLQDPRSVCIQEFGEAS